MRVKVNNELDRLKKEGIIQPVEFSDWAAPIVPVLKQDGSVRICGDYRMTINQGSRTDTYPIPRIQDIFAKLSGQTFTKLEGYSRHSRQPSLNISHIQIRSLLIYRK